jgi:hypothetical protein
MTNNHMDYLDTISAQDVATLREKERTYGGSWKKRGGVGAFMMLARKMDRLENIAAAANYDIFAVIRGEGLDGADGTLIAEIRDLRCYLMLVEAEMAAQAEGSVPLVCGDPKNTNHPAPFGYTEDDA